MLAVADVVAPLNAPETATVQQAALGDADGLVHHHCCHCHGGHTMIPGELWKAAPVFVEKPRQTGAAFVSLHPDSLFRPPILLLV
ncbi:hypothetical protein [Gallaecimonas pentaromativorans]|uniref:hypothetical protein n=1 Tax=Gallaecimonas pentaromativorans TaxID=584787 RepID=UPI003A9111E6